MPGRISGATERALKRVQAGEAPYAAAKAEGVSPSTIYRALRRHGRTDYAYAVGVAMAKICLRHGDAISAAVLNNVSVRPDLIRMYLRHIDLSGFDIPDKPAGWRPGRSSGSFWRGYCRGLESC